MIWISLPVLRLLKPLKCRKVNRKNNSKILIKLEFINKCSHFSFSTAKVVLSSFIIFDKIMNGAQFVSLIKQKGQIFVKENRRQQLNRRENS